jgi:hypothetical protein
MKRSLKGIMGKSPVVVIPGFAREGETVSSLVGHFHDTVAA